MKTAQFSRPVVLVEHSVPSLRKTHDNNHRCIKSLLYETDELLQSEMTATHKWVISLQHSIIEIQCLPLSYSEYDETQTSMFFPITVVHNTTKSCENYSKTLHNPVQTEKHQTECGITSLAEVSTDIHNKCPQLLQASVPSICPYVFSLYTSHLSSVLSSSSGMWSCHWRSVSDKT